MPIIPISGSATARGALIPLGSVVSPSTTNIVFSNIPQGYQDLVLITSLRNTTTNSGLSGPTIAFNSISTGYSTTQLFGNGSSPSSGRVTNNTATYNALYATDGSSLRGTFAVSEVSISGYASTTKFKTLLSQTNADLRGGTGQTGIVVNVMANTAAITSLTIFGVSSGPFAVNSTATLYAVRSVNQ
jgi:hypothetical protein